MRYGEIIELGRHKLMCGDATCREYVMRLVDGAKVDLVLTDPPYGINSVSSRTNTIGGHHASKMTKGRIVNAREYALVIGDNSTDSARNHYDIAKSISNKFIIWGGQYFAGLSSKLCMRFFLGHFRKTVRVSHIEVA